MINIINSKSNSTYLPELYNIFKNQWEDMEPFEFSRNGKIIPTPIMAFNNKELIGGLSFTLYKSPISDLEVIWINALVILPKYRKLGIAKKLIKEAQDICKSLMEENLYAYTNVPGLYKKLDWLEINQNDNHFVLCKKLLNK